MMKLLKTGILLIFYLTGFSAHPQLVVKENKIWSIASCGSEMPLILKTTHYMIGEEEVINDTVYHKLMYSTSYQPYNWNMFGAYPYIREQDSVIYRRHTENQPELMVFDMSKKVGENFYLKQYNDLLLMTMDSIVTRKVQGMDLKHWYASASDGQRAIFVERIGSFEGFLDPFALMYVGRFYYILCISEDGDIFYRNENVNACHITTITSSAGLLGKVAKPIIVSPRDNKQVLVTKHAETGGEIIFYTSTGREVKHSFLNDCETLLQLPIDGILIYQFVTNEGNVQSGRVLVR